MNLTCARKFWIDLRLISGRVRGRESDRDPETETDKESKTDTEKG